MMNKFVFTRLVGVVVIFSMCWLSPSPAAQARTTPLTQPQSANGSVVVVAVYNNGIPLYDAEYDRTRNQLYVTRNDDGGSWNPIVVLSVPTATMISTLPTGVARQLALSDDARYLYFGNSPATVISRMDFVSQTVDLQFPITPTMEFGCTSNEIYDMKVVPSEPDAIVIAKGPLPGAEWCVRPTDPMDVFDKGVPRPMGLPVGSGNHRLLFHGTPPLLYGDGPSGRMITVMKVISSGIQRLTTHFLSPEFTTASGSFAAAGNFLFRPDGEALNLATTTQNHVTDAAVAVAVSPDQSLVHYLSVETISTTNEAIYTIKSFDTVGLAPVKTLTARVPRFAPEAENFFTSQMIVINENQFVVRTNWQVVMLTVTEKEDPVANAGIDATISAETTLSLQGSGHVDPTSSSLAYLWQQTAGPHAIVSNPTIASPIITAPKQNGILEFGLRVTDSFGQVSVTDSVRITVTNGVYESYLPILHKADPVYLRAGVYPFTNYCAMTVPITDTQVNMCVTSVEVDHKGAMKFNLSWTLVEKPVGAIYVYKNSDAGNANMNIVDNLGTTYHHVAVGDGAYGITFYNVGETASGWFLFPPTQQREAFTFTFHDDDQHVTIPNITLPQSGE